MIAAGQHRLARLQVVNWGTFHGYFDLPVPRAGLLVTGPSGSGKSSLLDALASVLVQPRWLQFNAAAQEGGAADRSRSLVSYVRGAYKREADGATGEVSTTFLRPGATWSAVGLTYDDGEGRPTTVLRLFHLPRGTTAAGDLATVFCLAEEPVDLLGLQPFAENGLDQRRLKAAHPSWSVQTTYSAFAPRLQRRLGLASDQAQRLLHKTQSAKNLTSLDTLLREFMLDQPDTFDLVTSATEQFHELAAAHGSVVDARRQKDALASLRPIDTERTRWLAERDALALEQEHLETVRLSRQLERTASEVGQLETRLERLASEVEAADDAERARRDDRDAAWRLVEGRGGRELEALEHDAAAQRSTLERRAQLRRQVQATADAVGLALPAAEAGWAAFVAEADAAAAALAEGDEAREARHRLSGEHADARDRVRGLEGELQALRVQRSGLEQPLVTLRDALVAATGASAERLPFAGELIEVQPDEAAWTGPIERILRSLARTLLVPDDLYPHVSSLVDERSLGLRLLYVRVPGRVDAAPEPTDARSLVHKVAVAASEHADWLSAELARRFDYACVDSVGALRGVTRGVTRSGQVRYSDTRHEKDDRSGVDDRRTWVLGSSRAARQEALTAALAEAQAAEASARQARDAAEAARDDRLERSRALALVRDLTWEQVDVGGAEGRLAEVQRRADSLRATAGLAEAQGELARAEQQLAAALEQARGLRERRIRAEADRDRLVDRRERWQREWAGRPPVPDAAASRLSARFAEAAEADVDQAARLVAERLAHDVQAADRRLGNAANRAERVMQAYKQGWPAESADLAIQVDFLPDYLAILERLEADRLPEFEDRFFDLLQGQSRNNIGALAQRIHQSRREIRERVQPINDSLRQTEYAPGQYLHVRVDDRRLPDVTVFLRDLAEITSGSLEDALGSGLGAEERVRAEARFVRMRDLVRRLSSTEPDDVRWRTQCLDTRLHVQFLAEVRDTDGQAVDWFVGAAGLSGGERQKLVTFCLAAALRYQLARDGAPLPNYGLVVLDEAFDKTDPAFTRAGLDVFRTFGFQLLLATPLKMLQTLEDYVGGAAVVLNEAGSGSRLELMLFDEVAASEAPEGAAQESLL